MTEISVVIPVYNCAGCLRALHGRLTATLSALTADYEIVLVDDRSRDGAWEILTTLARSDPRLRVVRLSRNFGQHAAITAGLTRSRGAWTVVMDCDLQEPPEEIAGCANRLLDQWQDGEERDIRADMTRLTLEIVAKVLFDVELDTGDMSPLTGLDRGERTGPDPDTFNYIPG